MSERFLLTWKRTWPDRERQDYTGKLAADPIMFARIYFANSVPSRTEQWFWTVSATHHIASGHATDARAAARAAEAAYVRHVNAIVGTAPFPTRR
jgi:hypothetical protein